MAHSLRIQHYPDSKVCGANMGPVWGRQDPGGPHVGRMNIIIWVFILAIWAKSDEMIIINTSPMLNIPALMKKADVAHNMSRYLKEMLSCYIFISRRLL